MEYKMEYFPPHTEHRAVVIVSMIAASETVKKNSDLGASGDGKITGISSDVEEDGTFGLTNRRDKFLSEW